MFDYEQLKNFPIIQKSLSTIKKRSGKYSVNGAPFQELKKIQLFLQSKFNVNCEYDDLKKLFDENAKSNKVSEKDIQVKVHQMFGGVREVNTPVGFIDVLTDTQLIEVKSAETWKHSVGQLLSYSKFYPNHEMVMYLFGKFPRNLNECASICKQHGIKLMYEMVS
jgi:hypothetical protein